MYQSPMMFLPKRYFAFNHVSIHVLDRIPWAFYTKVIHDTFAQAFYAKVIYEKKSPKPTTRSPFPEKNYSDQEMKRS